MTFLLFSTGDLSRWIVNKVKDASFMFQFATSFNSDLSGWKLLAVENTGWMFRGAIHFDNGTKLESWELPNVDVLTKMFAGAIKFDASLCGWSDIVDPGVDTRSMFVATSCPEKESVGSSWCQICPSRHLLS
jgi:hypothetical protein